MSKGLASGVRIAALLGCILAGQQAWAGFYLYQGERALLQGNAVKSIEAAEAGLRINAEDPELYDLLGRGYWQRYSETKNQGDLEKSWAALHGLLWRNPDHPRGWIYKALVFYEREKNSEEGIAKEDWKRIRFFLEKAKTRDPGSSWVRFAAIKMALNQRRYLSTEEINQTLDDLRETLQLHDPNQPSNYLSDAMEMIWAQFRSFNVLKRVVPDDFHSMNRLLRFLEKQGLREEADSIRIETEEKRRQQYDWQCGKAEDLFKRGYRDRAFEDYQICSWIDNQRIWAEAGMLAAGFGDRRLQGDPGEWLERILKDRRESLDFLMPHLEPAAREVKGGQFYEAYAQRLKDQS